MENLFIYTNIYCLNVRTGSLMFISDGLRPSIVRPKKEKTRPMGEEMDGKVLIPARVSICTVYSKQLNCFSLFIPYIGV